MHNEVLSGRTVAITGIGSGIGKSTALRFLAEGARLVGADLYEERLTQFREDAESLGLDPSMILTMTGDASDYGFAGTLIDRAVERFGKLDILMNNAGGSMGFGGTTFNELDRNAWDLTIETNLYTTLNCTKHAAEVHDPTEVREHNQPGVGAGAGRLQHRRRPIRGLRSHKGGGDSVHQGHSREVAQVQDTGQLHLARIDPDRVPPEDDTRVHRVHAEEDALGKAGGA